ncbi:MAG: MarR family transcriptional regulator [Solirubrobacterales bacterium]|nr:MarR family transcriptional regulator [Solirubrobacterales bacterium]
MSARTDDRRTTVGTVMGERQEGDAAEQVARSFKRAMAAVRRLRGRETHRPGEVTDAQYSLLFCLRDQSPMSVRDLADAADLSPASVTEMLEGLATVGLVRRERSARDRRVVLTSLTENGRRLVEERRARFEPRFRAAMSEFADGDLLIAAGVLERLRGLFEELAGERNELVDQRR